MKIFIYLYTILTSWFTAHLLIRYTKLKRWEIVVFSFMASFLVASILSLWIGMKALGA